MVCKTLSDCDDVDFVWESMSSLTLQDYDLSQAVGGDPPHPSCCLMPPHSHRRTLQSLCSTIPSSREQPMLLFSGLLSISQGYLVVDATMEDSRCTLPALLLRQPTSSPSVSACIPAQLQLRIMMVELHFISCVSLMQRDVMHSRPGTGLPLKSA